MHGWMTSRHEGCVSTMLTDKRLKYCTAGAPLQGSGATKWRMQADKRAFRGAFRLDNARGRVKLQRGVTGHVARCGQGPRTAPRVAWLPTVLLLGRLATLWAFGYLKDVIIHN